MSEFENLEAMELSMEEMDQAAGGASRYAPLKNKAGYIVYKVRKGDTLIRIASAHHCTVNDILRWNPKISDKRVIYANESLYIRVM